mgnify:CR=1 FL=1
MNPVPQWSPGRIPVAVSGGGLIALDDEPALVVRLWEAMEAGAPLADLLRELEQLGINLCDVLKVRLRDLHLHARFLADLLQDVKPSASAHALQGVRRIRDMLQLFEHKDRNEQCPLEKSRLTDIRDAPVDDDARIEQFILAFRLSVSHLHRQRCRNTPLTDARHLAQETRNKVKCLRNFLLFLDHNMDAEIAKHYAEHDGNVAADDRDRRKRIAQQACNNESDEKTYRSGYHIARRHLAKLSFDPDGKTLEASDEKW